MRHVPQHLGWVRLVAFSHMLLLRRLPEVLAVDACVISPFLIEPIAERRLHRFIDSDNSSLSSLKNRLLVVFCNGLLFVADVLITLSFCYYLHSHKLGIKR